MFVLDARRLHHFQHTVLFVLFWSRIAGELSFRAGLLLYIILTSIAALFNLIMEKRKVRPFLRDILVPSVLFLLLPLVRLMIPVSALFPAPGNLFLLHFFLYLLPVLPYVVLFRGLTILALRFRPAHYVAIGLYLIIAVLLLSRRGWGLFLPGESIVLAAAFMFSFLLLELLLILSAGQRDGRISIVPGLLVLFFLPLLTLIPINRFYEQESRSEGGGLLESSLFRFDFSDYLSLESSISMKKDLVFFLRLEGPGEDLRIRRFVLPAYDGAMGFHRDKEGYPEAPGLTVEDPLVGESPRHWDSGRVYENRERLEQEYYLVNFDAGAFLGLNHPVGVIPYTNWDSSSFSRIYAVESDVSRTWGWELMDDEALDPAAENSGEASNFLEYYSRWNEDETLKDLAVHITLGKHGYYARVKAVEEYLQNEYYYSLEPGSAPDGNQLNYFLFDAKKGYCSYSAFAMTMLCRSLGIPARVVLGFWVPGNSEVLNFYPVRADQAHAWVEVYFPRFGWMEFDPTSTIPAPGEEYPFTSPSPDELEGYLKEILENRDSLEVQNSLASEETSGENFHRKTFFGRRRFFYPVSGLIVLVIALLVLRTRLLLRAPRKRFDASLYFHLHLVLAGCPKENRHSGDKIRSFIEERKLSELSDMLSNYENVRFGCSSLMELTILDELGRALRKRLICEAGPGAKIRYLLRLIFFRRYR